MSQYTILDYKEPDYVTYYDELPYWSTQFGKILLDNIPMFHGMRILDIGCATGFPFLEIAQRMGTHAKVYGIDPWRAALDRLIEKLDYFEINNTEVHEGDAADTHFTDNYFHLIVSNLALNNMENPEAVFTEAFRILQKGGTVALTTNPKGHMQEFYDAFEKTLILMERTDLLNNLQKHIDHRMTAEQIQEMFEKIGFTECKIKTDTFTQRYFNGRAFFTHNLIRMGFLEGWMNLIPEDIRETFFRYLELILTDIANKIGELTITIPILYFEAQK